MDDKSQSYRRFCARLLQMFDLDWDKYGPRIDASFDYLSHIPADAYKGMEQIAVSFWNRWPLNFPKAVIEIYEQWRHENKHTARPAGTFCEYCNSAGVFSGIKRVDVKPGVRMSYRFAFRCAACRNWLGVYGDKLPTAWPLELKSQGYEIELSPKPLSPEPQRDPPPSKTIFRRPEYLSYRQ